VWKGGSAGVANRVKDILSVLAARSATFGALLRRFIKRDALQRAFIAVFIARKLCAR